MCSTSGQFNTAAIDQQVDRLDLFTLGNYFNKNTADYFHWAIIS